jgi:hypothetical protein
MRRRLAALSEAPEPRWVRWVNNVGVALAAAWWASGRRSVLLETAFLIAFVPAAFWTAVDLPRALADFRAHPRLALALVAGVVVYCAAIVVLRASPAVVLLTGAALIVVVGLATFPVLFDAESRRHG